jgi:hypothetical protein
MARHQARARRDVSEPGPSPAQARDAGAAKPVPLLVTAELPAEVLAWADGLRRAHYPPGRNRLQAHATLFHGLPPSARGEVERLLAEAAGEWAAPEAKVTGIMDLGRGTAFAIDSPGMSALHEMLAQRLHGLIQQKDARELKLHVTVQNKVGRKQARSLQKELAAGFAPRAFRFAGLGLYGWDGQLWNFERLYPFRGRARAGEHSG